MIKKYWIVVLASIVMIIAAVLIMNSKKNTGAGSNHMLPVSLRAIKLPDGWGYEVFVDNKIYIHQDCIPAISANRRFTTESEALLIGNLVIDKIKHGHKPIMTVREIDSAHIHY